MFSSTRRALMQRLFPALFRQQCERLSLAAAQRRNVQHINVHNGFIIQAKGRSFNGFLPVIAEKTAYIPRLRSHTLRRSDFATRSGFSPRGKGAP